MIKRARRPTSLQLEDKTNHQITTTSTTTSSRLHHPPFLRATSVRQKQLRLGVSSLVVTSTPSTATTTDNNPKTDSGHISRNATCASPFAPYSPLARNTSASALCPALRPLPERPASSQSAAQVNPNRLSCRPSRPPSRALARPVVPPTSPVCDNPGLTGGSECLSPTSSLMSGPLSPTSSVLSPFQPISELETASSSASPFQSEEAGQHHSALSPSPFQQQQHHHHHQAFSSLPEAGGGAQVIISSDQESISSRSQTDSISLR